MTLRRTRPALLAIALALCVPSLAAQGIDPPRGIDAGPCIEGICEYRLENGLRVLLFPDPGKPTVTVNIAYGVGSVHENYGETGMAHLLEHLMFKGTPTHPEIPAELQRRGIEKNATTSLDRTNYYGSFPANDATLDWLLGLEADRMVNSNIARADLDSEMTVVRNEMERGENNPGAVIMQRLRSTAFLWHNYGQSTIGARSDVEHVPIERLQAFYRRWYRPDNATLIVAGRIDPATTLAMVQRHFAGIERPEAALPVAWTTEPTQDGEREVTVRRSGDMRLLAAGYHVPAATHPDSAALAVAMNILGDTPGGRLHKALVEGGLAAGTGTGMDTLQAAGLATVIAVTQRDGDADALQEALLAQVEALAEAPFTEAEVALARQRIANGYEQNFNNVNAVAMALTESVAAGDWRLYFLRRDRIAAVTADDVNRVATAYFKRSNRTLARFVPTDAPDRAAIPAAPTAADALEGYVAREALASGEAFDPTPANIDARTEHLRIGTLDIALLPKETRGDVVTVNATFRFGDAESLRGHEAGALAGAMLMRGSTTLSRQQIADRLDALRTTGGVNGGLQSAGFTLQSRRDTVAEALELAADVLRHPAFPEAEFEQFQRQAITGLEASRKEPGPVASNAMGLHFDPWPEGHPLHAQSTDETLAMLRATTVDALRAFHREFYGTAQGEITVTGDFDPDAMKAQIERLFPEWTSAHPYAPIHTRHTAVEPVDVRLETPDKANAVLLARGNLSLNEDDPDYPALVVADRILGGDPLKSRLGDRLRQREGLTYGVGSGLSADASRTGRDDAGRWIVQASAAPGNIDALASGIREELARLAADGITAAELADAVNGLRVEREQALASDGTLVGTLGRNLYLGRTMAHWAAFDERLAALTVEDVNAALRRHLVPERFSVFVAGDFDGAD